MSELNKQIKKSAIIFTVTLCAVCTVLTGGLTIPLGLFFGLIFYLLELFYLRIYNNNILAAEEEARRPYTNKIIINSVSSIGLLSHIPFFIFAVCSLKTDSNFLWTAFSFSAIFALIAYLFYIGAAITEFYLTKRKRALLKAAFILIIGLIGTVSYGYSLAGGVIWSCLSGAVFVLELLSIIWMKRYNP